MSGLAPGGGEVAIGFQRLVDLAHQLVAGPALALGYEMANRDPDIPSDDLLYEIRASLNRVSAAAASLYAA